MRRLSPPIFPSVTSLSLISACLVLRPPPPPSFLPWFSSLTDRNESPGLLAFSSSTETKKERWRRKKRKRMKKEKRCCQFALHPFVRRAGKTPWITSVSAPPHTHHTHTTHTPPSWSLIRITQFMGISVWSVAQEIAGLSVIILITPCGCDYMCIWVLCVLRQIQRSGQYLPLPS